jgi:proteasome lid subunit RPN8/RPN11
LEEDKPQILLWTVPECPCRITLLASVINEVRILAVEAFYSVPRGGVEIGGVFFGIREPDAIHIRAHRQIRCEYATGPSFTLSVKDQLGLSGLLDQAHVDPDLAGMAPLGWYHSHTRSEISLSPADLQLYSEFFPDRWQVAMVMRPANLQPTRAGFFARDRFGAVKSDSPLQEFKLEPPTFGLSVFDGETPAPQPRAASAPAAGELQLMARGPMKVVPIAADPPAKTTAAAVIPIAKPALEPALPSPPPSVKEPSLTIVPAKAQAAASDTAAPAQAKLAESKPAKGKELVSAAPPVEPAPVPAVAPAAAPDPQVPRFLAETPPVKKSHTWIWAIAGILLLCGAGGTALLKWTNLSRPMDLGLETYDINGAFLIRWDRESSVVRGARHATLEIQDGAEKTPIELSRAELAVGGYGYIRHTGQVSVRMKVDGSFPAEEYSNFSTAQALGSKTATAPEKDAALAKAIEEKEHLKTELINESMQSVDLRREITSLRRQLEEARASQKSPPPQQ